MVWNDVRYALRLMRRSPGFTAAAVLSLGLGIGANAAIFSLFNTIMLHRLPVAHPEQLVEFLRKSPGEPRSDGYWGWEKYEHFRDHNHVFSALTGMFFDNGAMLHTDGSDAERVVVENVVGNYFPVLGLKPAMGRLLGPEDVPARGEGDTAVVSWFYWDSRMHRDPAVIGKRIFVNDAPMTIVGVAPRAYSGPRVGVRTDVWAPHERDQLDILGRLKPGVTVEQAQAEMAVLYQSLWQQSASTNKNPQAAHSQIELESAGAGLSRVRDQYGKSLALLMGVVGVLLLLACINMASMLLARSAGRQREMAVRVGLGASRSHLVRQMLTESVLLSMVGALVGILLAYFGTGVLVRIIASGRLAERVEIEVQPDLRLLLYTAGIALLTGLVFGLAPAWYAFRCAPASGLRQTGRGGDMRFWRMFGKGLVAAQVALSILLVTAAAVFLSHVSRLRSEDLGFRSDHVLLMTLDPARSGYTREQLAAPYQELLVRLQRIPGVISASITGCTPIQGCGSGSRFVTVEGYVERPEERKWNSVMWVAPKYFETLGIPLIAGRDFTFGDAGRPRVAIVSQAMARHYFPSGNPIGKHVTVVRDARVNNWSGIWYGDGPAYEIVGVAGDAKASELREAPRSTMYFNMFQGGHVLNQFELRTRADPASVAGAAQRMVREVLKTVPVTRVTTLSEQVDGAIVPERLIATLSGYFGALAATLAGIGLYGLLAYTVARRTNEIGVRMALGARASDVSRLVLGDALGMVCAGLVGGAAMVFWSRPLAASLVQDLKLESVAPVVLGGGLIVAVALVAAYVPARRAAGVDPMAALRHE
jgi:putative ABC transport system permease protein